MKITYLIKKIGVLSAISATLALSVISANALTADVNNDDVVNITDVTTIQKVLVNLEEPPENFDINADVDEDGFVTINDATKIQKMLVGIDDNTEIPPEPSYLELDKTSITLGTGEEYRLKIDCDVDNCPLSFITGNSEVAEISDDGTITAVGKGQTIIACTTQNGITATCNVTVGNSTTSLALNRTDFTLGIGEKFTLKDYVDEDSVTYKKWYSSDNPEIASVNSETGEFTAHSVGTTSVYCNLYNGMRVECKIKVMNPPDSVSLNSSSETLKVGEEFTLIEQPNSGSTSSVVYWESSNSKVIKILQQTGRKLIVKAQMEGTSYVTVKTYNGKTATCKFTVSGTTVKCLDVSWCQSSVDFNAVKQAGYDYVIIRAGYGRELFQKDSRFEENYAKAKAAGLKVGAYWFSYATSADEAFAEAEACLYCLGGKQLDLPLYYDLEYAPAIYNMSPTNYTKMATNFCETIRSAGYKPGIYASSSVFYYPLQFDVIKKYSLWNAQWDGKCDVPCDIWQYTEYGYCNGISSNVDMSYIFNLNIAE
ncbi:MAG: dockerin type I domain-containing protein [Ruminococcus sp.]|nr:dockerin type I domain-containing protein [Ruminococcus sp.]